MYEHQKELEEIINRLEKNSFKGKNVLVTGGAGFIGSWICEVLLEMDANSVVCLDNLSSGRWENISHLEKNPNFKFIKHDISIPIYFGKIIPNKICHPNIDERFDIIMHLASRASPFEFEKFPISILKSNTLGTLNALGCSKDHNAKFFYASTSETYGNPPADKVPTPESYYGNVNTIGPRS